MFSIVTLALAASASVSAITLPRGYRYIEDYETLEDYTIYHTRYLALNCDSKHDTSFFDQCCHPLLINDQLETSRPAYCTPTRSAVSSASAAEPTSTVATPYDHGCEEWEDNGNSSSSIAPVASIHEDVDEECDQPDNSLSTVHRASNTSTHIVDTDFAAKRASSIISDDDSEVEYADFQVITGGFATWYTQDGTVGACGKKHKDSELVVAMNAKLYGNMGKISSICGRNVVITNLKNGKTVEALVADACPGCPNSASIDLSIATFEKISTLPVGEIPIKWYYA
ncbi:hypothetical protein C8J56DRAFT_960111 [Mycena floridula]|nr:hypothetical protein C8J56DRAFT_960111 [Mycena floridula]